MINIRNKYTLLTKSNFACFWLLFVSCCWIQATAQNTNQLYNDGPYIDIIGDSLKIQWIEQGQKKDTIILSSEATVFDRSGLPQVTLTEIPTPFVKEWEYDNVKKFVALSDLHGQFDIFIELLKSNKIVDDSLNWIFDTNHLVITGDHFSRGDKVMEILWLLYKLDQQAILAGGHVHVMLGNHELMTLNNDLRYLHRKYAYTSGVLGLRYGDLFSTNSILGAWLRSKHVVISINDIVFVHGGLSMEAVNRNLSLDLINSMFRDSILSLDAKTLSESELTDFLITTDGPLWYRGYADSSFQSNSLDTILNFYTANHIVVGHTSMDEIITAFNNRVIFIDCSIKLGKKGEALVYDRGKFSKVNQKGEKKTLFEEKQKLKQSLFNFIYEYSKNDKNASIVLKTNMSGIIRNKMKEEFETATFYLSTPKNEKLLELNGKLRARGNMRKQVCQIPPVKFNFIKKELKKYNFANADKLKLVFPCRDGDYDQEKLYREFFAYQLYSIIDTNHAQVQLIKIKVVDKDEKVDYNFTGLMLEDEDAYALRTNAMIIGSDKKILSPSCDRNSFLKMFFFQYMIGNTDWSIVNRHNLFVIKKPEDIRVIAIPYDFDYSGIVNQRYAVPFDKLNIRSVTDRHFMPYVVKDDEIKDMITFYNSIKKEVYNLIRNADYLLPKTRKEISEFIDDYYKLLEEPNKLKSTIVEE